MLDYMDGNATWFCMYKDAILFLQSQAGGNTIVQKTRCFLLSFLTLEAKICKLFMFYRSMFHLKISIGELQVMNKRRIQFYFGAGLVSVLAILLWFGFDLPASISVERHESRQANFASTPEAKVDRDGQKSKKKAQSNDDAENEGVRVKGARPTPPFAIPATVPGKQYAYFIAMGDWGTGSPAQRQVAELMNAKAGRDSLHFVLLLGDNFYEKGVASVDDPQWQKKFERMYDLPFLNVPFFAALGNHDYKKAGSPDAQVEYSKRHTKWKMPARFYTFTRTL